MISTKHEEATKKLSELKKRRCFQAQQDDLLLRQVILEKLEQAIVFRKGSPICMEEFRDLRVFIHVNSDDYLERHYTEETADWCNHETRTLSVQQWIEHRPWVQLVQGPTKNLICAINEYKWKHYQLRCVVYDIQRAPYGGNYGPLSRRSAS